MASPNFHYQYDGSRMFSFVTEYIGIPVDQVNFVLSQVVALFLSTCFRTILHPSKVFPEARHCFGLAFGLITGYFCYGMQAAHMVGLPALCYIAMKMTPSPWVVNRVVLAVALMYLSCLHLHRQIYSYNSYVLDITGPIMVMTQKVTSLAFNLHDGLTTSEKELPPTRRKFAVTSLPTPLEYFSYVLTFPSIMAGPMLFYNEYMEFIYGKTFDTECNKGRLKSEEPSPTKEVQRKVVLAIFYVVIFVKCTSMFPLAVVKSEHFLKHTTLWYKFWYLSIVTMLVRFKYYFAWTMADAVCNNAGIGFNGFDQAGNSKWNKYSNIDMVKFEMATNLKGAIDVWNVGTNRWLRIVVYDRVKKYPMILTYALSAVWHGFYPGYYLTFANGALFTLAARTMRRHVRGFFQGSTEMKRTYDLLTFITTRFVMTYITFTFVLLEFWSSIRVYIHMYLCLHLLALAALAVPYFVPKSDTESASNLAASGANIANVLRQASPLTNSVSSRND